MFRFSSFRSFLAFLVFTFLPGCESAFDTRPITEKYGAQLQRLSLGMTQEQVKQIIPKVHLRGQTLVEEKPIDAYELLWRHTEYMRGDRVTERLWFYFHENRLVRWGGPNDWPSPQELNITIRGR